MADVATVPHSISDWHDSFFLLANDPAIQSLESIFAAIAGTHIPVLIVGEEGTGRSSAARAIHRMEFSGDDGLVEVAAAVVTEEMFAVWASAETSSETPGAAPNTLVLEEVSELDAACQWRLAQMLAANGKVGCRVIATTRKNLELEAHGGRFREDVLYQLNRVCLSLPPLRYRKHDV